MHTVHCYYIINALWPNNKQYYTYTYADITKIETLQTKSIHKFKLHSPSLQLS